MTIMLIDRWNLLHISIQKDKLGTKLQAKLLPPHTKVLFSNRIGTEITLQFLIFLSAVKICDVMKEVIVDIVI